MPYGDFPHPSNPHFVCNCKSCQWKKTTVDQIIKHAAKAKAADIHKDRKQPPRPNPPIHPGPPTNPTHTT